MGPRSRSVRLRIYFLVAIPLVAVAGTSIRNAVNLDRAPNLINATSLPTAAFTSYLQAERAAAVSYLFAPSPANLAAYNTAIAATSQHAQAFQTAMTSPATGGSETPSEATAISAALANLGQLKGVRAAVAARAITPMVALTDYSQGIAAEPGLFLTEANSETDAGAVGQALGLIATVQAREQLSQEWALLGGILAGNRMTRIDRVAITEAAATRQADLRFAQSMLTPANLASYDAGQNGSAAAQQRLAAVEQALAGGADVSQLPTTQAQWQQTAGTLLQDYYNGGVELAKAELVSDHQFGRSAGIRVAVTSGIALLGLLVTIVMTTLVARGIIRRLRGLERSALTLAEQQLPDVIARLRRGEDVDVAQEAPPLQAGPGPGPGSSADGPGSNSNDEIGRVGRSFDLVRQTAIRSAVDEARLRRGLNDVFRSLARRSQSLLHRQLTLLDQMERRATDPEALDDLFRLDHLTTPMRPPAEGLVILAGAPPSPGQPAAIAMAPHENDDPAAELTGRAGPAAPGLTELRALPGLPQAPGVRISGPLRRSQEVTPEPDGDAQPTFDVFMPRQRGQDLAQPSDPGASDPGASDPGASDPGALDSGALGLGGSYLASPPAGAGPLPGRGSRPYPDPGLAPVPGSAPYPDP